MDHDVHYCVYIFRDDIVFSKEYDSVRRSFTSSSFNNKQEETTREMIASLSKAVAPGFHVRNESDIPILFVFSQLSPLHWAKVEPGKKEKK